MANDREQLIEVLREFDMYVVEDGDNYVVITDGEYMHADKYELAAIAYRKVNELHGRQVRDL